MHNKRAQPVIEVVQQGGFNPLKTINKFGRLFSRETVRRIKAGEERFVDGVISIKKKITAVGNFRFIDSNTDELVGISDWNKKQLPNGQTMIVKGIKMGYASTSNSTDTEVRRKYSSLQTNVPDAILTARLSIRQFEKEYANLPVAFLFSEAISNRLNGEDENVYNFRNSFVIMKDKDVEMVLLDSAGLPLDNSMLAHFLSLDLIGDISIFS